ncbi:MAG: DegV family protein [Clostridia bacterium]|nr:DegV family protein [Clostridia bacterium]
MKTMDYIIATDADSELDLPFVQAHNVPVFPMPLMLDGEEYNYDLGITVTIPDFFERLAAGAGFSTSCKPPWEIKEWFRSLAQERSKNILYLGLSNQLSQHFNNCVMAANELMEEDPSVKILLVDTLSISIGQSALIYRAYKMQEQGASMEEIAEWTEQNKNKTVMLFSVDDLNYLKRGGRLSGSAAFFGTVLDIKPILCCNEEGRLVVQEKAKGRRKAWRRLADIAQEKIGEKGGTLLLTYSLLEGRQFIEKQLSEHCPLIKIVPMQLGPVIGGHTGPGVVGLAFIEE